MAAESGEEDFDRIEGADDFGDGAVSRDAARVANSFAEFRSMAGLNRPSREIHLHFYPEPEESVHWHLHVESPTEAAQGVRKPEPIRPRLEVTTTQRPAPNQRYSVRPFDSTTGNICAFGNTLIGSNPPDFVRGFIVHAAPSSSITLPAHAVFATIDSNTGNWRFDHNQPAGSAGSGQIGNEIPNARHSVAGEQNWLIIWAERYGNPPDIEVIPFIGVTDTRTFCQTGSSAYSSPLPASRAVRDPLPAKFALRTAGGAASMPLPEALSHDPVHSTDSRLVWRGGAWSLTIFSAGEELVAEVRQGCEGAPSWKGLFAPSRRNQWLAPTCGDDSLPSLELTPTT